MLEEAGATQRKQTSIVPLSKFNGNSDRLRSREEGGEDKDVFYYRPQPMNEQEMRHEMDMEMNEILPQESTRSLPVKQTFDQLLWTTEKVRVLVKQVLQQTPARHLQSPLLPSSILFTSLRSLSAQQQLQHSLLAQLEDSVTELLVSPQTSLDLQSLSWWLSNMAHLQQRLLSQQQHQPSPQTTTLGQICSRLFQALCSEGKRKLPQKLVQEAFLHTPSISASQQPRKQRSSSFSRLSQLFSRSSSASSLSSSLSQSSSSSSQLLDFVRPPPPPSSTSPQTILTLLRSVLFLMQSHSMPVLLQSKWIEVMCHELSFHLQRLLTSPIVTSLPNLSSRSASETSLKTLDSLTMMAMQWRMALTELEEGLRSLTAASEDAILQRLPMRWMNKWLQPFQTVHRLLQVLQVLSTAFSDQALLPSSANKSDDEEQTEGEIELFLQLLEVCGRSEDVEQMRDHLETHQLLLRKRQDPSVSMYGLPEFPSAEPSLAIAASSTSPHPRPLITTQQLYRLLVEQEPKSFNLHPFLVTVLSACHQILNRRLVDQHLESRASLAQQVAEIWCLRVIGVDSMEDERRLVVEWVSADELMEWSEEMGWDDVGLQPGGSELEDWRQMWVPEWLAERLQAA